jgi:glycosyltransferase involved in cell wall biosynthesis
LASFRLNSFDISKTMNKKIKISVILSFYNPEITLLKRAIDSVLNQDYIDFELILVDDGSILDLKVDLNSYLSNPKFNINYYRHNNIGQSFTINEIVPLCKGEYITMIDADDEYKSNHLSVCLQEMKGADLIASTSETIVDHDDENYVVDNQHNEKRIHVDDCILFATLFGKREVFEKHQFEKIYSADSVFFEAASADYVVKKVNLRTYIYYRNNPNSICTNYKKEQSKSII